MDDESRVRATPGWTMRQLMAHVVGVCVDLVNGNVGDWAEPNWTAAQVDHRTDRSREQLLEEWAAVLPEACRIIDDPSEFGLDGVFGRVPLIDLLVHEDDVRESMGGTRDIDPDDWAIVAPHRLANLDGMVQASALPPLRVRTHEGDDWMVGGGEAVHELRLPRQELWRSLTGRRSRRAVQGYEWNTDPTSYLPAWVSSSFGWPAD